MNTQVFLPIRWATPEKFKNLFAFPKARGVYAILFKKGVDYKMVRIGATRDLQKRPADYNPLPFKNEPRLRITYTAIPTKFRDGMKKLINQQYPKRIGDIDWLEYRMECLLLDLYEERFGLLPPANFQRGSKREYMNHIKLLEEGPLHITELEPASLTKEFCIGLRQSKLANN